MNMVCGLMFECLSIMRYSSIYILLCQSFITLLFRLFCLYTEISLLTLTREQIGKLPAVWDQTWV